MIDNLNDSMADVQAALKVLDPDTAEKIIGSAPQDEYGILIRGTRGVVTVLYAVLKNHGLAKNEDTLQAIVKAMSMLLQIVNYAYALGIRRGQDSK